MERINLGILFIIAKYELKALFRNNFFRIFSLLIICSLVFINTAIFVILPFSQWSFRSISSSIPYANLILLNIFQVILCIYLATISMNYESYNTIHAIHTRSMKNLEYIIGKILAILIVIGGLNIIVLFISYLFNSVFTDDVAFVKEVYLLYPLFITLPTIIYICGLTFLLMVLLRKPGITFTALIAYFIIILSYLSNQFHHVFDFLAINTPLLYSDFVGFGDITNALNLRIMYFCFGLGFIFATAFLFRRLSQSSLMKIISIALSFFFFMVGIYSGNSYLGRISYGRNLRGEIIELNGQLRETPKISMIDCNLNLKHQGCEIEISAQLTFKNDTTYDIDKYLFSLNPGLKIESIYHNGKIIDFTRNLHIIEVEPSHFLSPGGIDSLKIVYRGEINEDACYAYIDEKKRYRLFKVFFYNINKRYSFITPEYVLLTPENLWYPIAGIPYGATFPYLKGKDFINFTLRVSTYQELIPISQGKITKVDEGEYLFKPEYPLPQISCVIGNYKRHSITVDNIEYNLFIMPGHEYYSPYFSEFCQSLPEEIRNAKEFFERKIELSYPYNRFSLIEVPVCFCSYQQLWTLCEETVQPEQVYLTEKGFLLENSDFKLITYAQANATKKQKIIQTQDEIEKDIFKRFVYYNFLGGFESSMLINRAIRSPQQHDFTVMEIVRSIRRRNHSLKRFIYPNYYHFVNSYKSNKWPIFDVAVEHFLESRLESIQSIMTKTHNIGLSNQERANIELKKRSFTKALEEFDNSGTVFDVIRNKSIYLFTIIHHYVGKDTFDAFLLKTIEDNRFRTIDVTDLLKKLEEQFNFDFTSYFDTWYIDKNLPAFVISEFESYQLDDEDKMLFQIKFLVSNQTSIDGLVLARAGTGGVIFASKSGEEYSFEDINRLIYVEGNQTKEIGILVNYPAKLLLFDTFISQNLPSTLFYSNIFIGNKEKNAKPFDGERVVDEDIKKVGKKEHVIDNEDPEFSIVKQEPFGFLQKILNNKKNKTDYFNINRFHPPNVWTPVIHNDFYGKYIRSALYKKSGEGKNVVSWKANIPENGDYDIYFYIPNVPKMNNLFDLKDFHFSIHHNEGVDDIIVNFQEVEEKWILLGSFALLKGKMELELSDISKGNFVYADAIKIVKR